MSHQITPEFLQQVGISFVSMVGTQYQMGHTRASSTAADYITPVGLSPAELLVRDVLAICTVKPMPEEEARVREFIEQSDIAAKIASAVVR